MNGQYGRNDEDDIPALDPTWEQGQCIRCRRNIEKGEAHATGCLNGPHPIRDWPAEVERLRDLIRRVVEMDWPVDDIGRDAWPTGDGEPRAVWADLVAEAEKL